MTKALDPIAMARFLVMPGAAELFEAFSRIPPGPLRESVIHHAQVIAQTYAGAPPDQQMPDPLLTAGTPPGAHVRPSLEAPGVRRRVKTEDPKTRAVELRLEGKHPQQIARELGLPRSIVEREISEARKAGLKVPNLRTAHGRPLEEKTWTTDFNELSAQGASRVADAAKKRGLSPQAYLDLKAKAVSMAQDGHTYPAIMEATGATQKAISLWLSNARAAGINVPYAAQPSIPTEFEEAPPSNIVQVNRWFGPYDAIQAKGRASIEKAARRRSMTPQTFLDLQESIVRHRLAGMGHLEIAALTGENVVFVRDTLQSATRKGAHFPPVNRSPAFEAAQQKARANAG